MCRCGSSPRQQPGAARQPSSVTHGLWRRLSATTASAHRRRLRRERLKPTRTSLGRRSGGCLPSLSAQRSKTRIWRLWQASDGTSTIPGLSERRRMMRAAAGRSDSPVGTTASCSGSTASRTCPGTRYGSHLSRWSEPGQILMTLQLEHHVVGRCAGRQDWHAVADTEGGGLRQRAIRVRRKGLQ